MSQNIKYSQGFTLVELLVSIVIMGGLSLISVKLLYDTVSIRSKQYSIENSAESIRPIISTLSSAIQSAQSITFPNTTSIKIKGIQEAGLTPCMIFQYNNSASIPRPIEMISDYTDCSSSPKRMTPDNVDISTFNITSSSPITINIVGVYKDGLGEHEFNYSTSVTNRLSI